VAEAGTAYIEFKGDYSAVSGADVARHGRRAGDDFSKGFGGSLRTGLAGAGSALVGFAKNSALLLGGLGVAGGAWGLSIAAQGEQAQIAFETMLGSGEKAKAFLDELKAFAASTPFEFPELQTAASSLIAAGFAAEDVIPIMTTLGDVTSGMGTGAEGVQRATVALQQMAAAGRITGEDLNQLRDAGIPVFDLLASATGKSKEEIAALAQAGKLGSRG
jgi:tape measure domain-containing protein